jgi:hypothetical protein
VPHALSPWAGSRVLVGSDSSRHRLRQEPRLIARGLIPTRQAG